MDADYDEFEIARVIHGFRLIDSESYERQYRLPDWKVLAPGYYVVSWPGNVKVRRFDQDAVFHGPFAHRQDAQHAAERMRARVAPIVFGRSRRLQGGIGVRTEESPVARADGRLIPLSVPAVGVAPETQGDAKYKHRGILRSPHRDHDGKAHASV